MPGVGLPADDRQHQLLAAGTDPDRRMRLLDRARPVGGPVEVVVTALEGGAVASHQGAHHLDRLFQALGALAHRWKDDPELGVLGLVPGRPYADLQPATRDVVDGDRLGGQHRGMPVGDAGDQRPEPDPRGGHCQSREQRPAFQAGPFPVAVEGREMVEDPGSLETGLLTEADTFQQLLPGELMLGDVQPQANWRHPTSVKPLTYGSGRSIC